MDLTCTCGAEGHVDGWSAYFVRCPRCGTIWQLADRIELTKMPDDLAEINLEMVVDEEEER